MVVVDEEDVVVVVVVVGTIQLLSHSWLASNAMLPAVLVPGVFTLP